MLIMHIYMRTVRCHDYAKTQAVLAAVKNSFAALRQRLFCTEPGDTHPLFEVAVELSVPAVALSPPLPTIQQAVNSAIKQARLCSRITSLQRILLHCWICAP